jgi:predicted  nucleic acid-binding Zn-ribbon protein
MNKPLPDDTKVSVARLCTAAEKLLQETERLRRDVVALNQRVQPIEEQGPGAARIEEPQAERKVWKAVDALNLIVAARDNIINSEHELSAIRARIDAIERDAISREEMKPWIKQSS